MEGGSEFDPANSNRVHLDLDHDELLALLSYIALGLNFSAIRSGQGNFLLPHEITAHSARIKGEGADRLITKLTTASLALADRK